MLGCWGGGGGTGLRAICEPADWPANSSGLWERQACSAQQKYQRKMAAIASKAKDEAQKESQFLKTVTGLIMLKTGGVPCCPITVRSHSFPQVSRGWDPTSVSVWLASQTWLSAGGWGAKHVLCYRPSSRACRKAQLRPREPHAPAIFSGQIHHSCGMNVNQMLTFRDSSYNSCSTRVLQSNYS